MEVKKCLVCKCWFNITDKDIEFYEKVSPIFNWKKYSIPSPRLCSDCRQQRRLSFRNERSLYKRKCDATGEDIISLYKPTSKYTVYNSDFWWSDQWDAKDYARNINIKESFLKQFNELMEIVPQLWMIHINSYNSDFTSFTLNSNNCYTCSWVVNSEDCLYSQFLKWCNNVLDSLMVYNSEQCYQGIDSHNCYGCNNFIRSTDCKNCYFISDCIECENCIDCSNLIWKKYYYKNEYVGKEKIEEIIRKWVHKEENTSEFYKYANIQQSENCTWDAILSSKNCSHCFDIIDVEDSKYVYFTPHGRDSYDCTYTSPTWVEYCYEVCSSMWNNFYTTFRCWEWYKNFYSVWCDNCENIFWCTGLRNQKYCILNKQYTKEEYETLVPKIIEKMKEDWEWWEFFPSSMSPFWYNETVANEYFPLTKTEALDKWFNWSDYEAPFPKVAKIIPANKLPRDITEIPDDILNWAIECEITKKPFRIIRPELDFYRKYSLPIPKRHPDQRHLDRMSLRNPRKLYERNCDKCSKNIESTYAPERKETVYCESCYNNQI